MNSAHIKSAEYQTNSRSMDEQNFEMMRFDLPKDQSSIIKVIGVGGGGSNAVNYMYEQGIKDVDFIVCNTDAQALDKSPVPVKVQLGATLTEGRGAGSLPEVGRNAAVETLEDIKAILSKNTTMVFITAGMGGGTGTGAAPVIAAAAREMGILTVGIVTVPFLFEGKRRSTQAESGLQEMREAVDTLLVIRNDKLRELYGNLSLKKAFDHADEVLCTAAKGIAEVITLTGEINVDMNDVNTVMRNSGVAIMGSGKASGEGRAMKAVTQALESPLLNDNDITGANFVLLNITYGMDEVLMDEITEITDHIQEKAGMSAEVIWGYGADETLDEDLCITVIATGFKANEIDAGLPVQAPKTVKHNLSEVQGKEITAPVNSPTASTQQSNYITFESEEATPFLKTNELAEDAEETSKEETPALGGFTFHALDKDTEELSNNEITPTLFNLNEEEEIKSEEASTDHLNLQELETPEAQKPVYYTLEDDSPSVAPSTEITDSFKHEEQTPYSEERPSRQELSNRNREREQRIREFTVKLKTPNGLSDLENEPAYRRREIQLDNTPHSADSNVSRYTLSEEQDEDGNKKVNLKGNNPFLHDNVD